ncbi:PAS domain-containing sensor histidine kinase [Aliidiomarina minuta]|uniref:histidine kinase n=1 Tax=Aliidiomarina minuta TaxID=880057 RepID=A0A432W4S2_9GAMM|nr:ATP-binding protein [Aliidiomarina minuta]RUO24503.1 PAS domain-containing sensor histidine kinase [Aliidiomarina minuta]
MTQAAAVAQKVQMDSVLAAMPNGVLMLDSRGVISSANPAAERLLGQQLNGELWRDVISSAFSPREDDGHEVSLVSGQRVRLDISSLQPDPGQLIVITDMSETRALQARVGQMQRLSAMGRMVASLAHQIRTPLSAAMLYAENLRRDKLPSAQREKFSRKLTDRLQDLEQQVNDMLLFAKSGEQLPVEHLFLNDVVREVAEQVEPLAQRESIQLEVVIADEDAEFIGNMSALTSAIQNLVMNALQACPKNSRVGIAASLNEEQLFIQVLDNGPGIDKKDLEHIFTPFFTRKSQGTGLGLAVVKTVAKAHQGSIRVDSEVGRGTIFTLALPVYRGNNKHE